MSTTNLILSGSNSGSLGIPSKPWTAVHANEFHGDGSQLTGITTDQISDPADNYLTTHEQDPSAPIDIVGVGATITVDTDLTYTPGQYITITNRLDTSLNQLSRIVSYNALSGQLQYAAPYSVGAGVANGSASDIGPWDINIAETPTPRYATQSTTPVGISNSTGNPLGFGAAGEIDLGFDLQYEAGDYVNIAYQDPQLGSGHQIAEVMSYDTETGVLVFDIPAIVSAPFGGSYGIVYTVTLVESGVALQTQINNLTGSVSAEEAARIAADANLQTQITNLTGTVGADGDSAYDIWVANGNTGTEQEFLNSLVGLDGATGPAGPAGADGDSVYETWLDEGNSGTQQDFLDSLVGATGSQGPQGAPGNLTGSVTNLSASGHISASFYGGLGGTMASHIIPSENAQFDLGNAEYKIRHLFLSDNSLWVGDNHKVSIENGKAKFKKMGLSTLPTELTGSGFSGDATQLGITELEQLARQEGLYGNPNFQITDLFTTADFEDDMGVFEKVQLPLTTQVQEEQEMPPLGTMIYDTNENVVKVVADDGNGLVFKTLAFM